MGMVGRRRVFGRVVTAEKVTSRAGVLVEGRHGTGYVIFFCG